MNSKSAVIVEYQESYSFSSPMNYGRLVGLKAGDFRRSGQIAITNRQELKSVTANSPSTDQSNVQIRVRRMFNRMVIGYKLIRQLPISRSSVLSLPFPFSIAPGCSSGDILHGSAFGWDLSCPYSPTYQFREPYLIAATSKGEPTDRFKGWCDEG